MDSRTTIIALRMGAARTSIGLRNHLTLLRAAVLTRNTTMRGPIRQADVSTGKTVILPQLQLPRAAYAVASLLNFGLLSLTHGYILCTSTDGFRWCFVQNYSSCATDVYSDIDRVMGNANQRYANPYGVSNKNGLYPSLYGWKKCSGFQDCSATSGSLVSGGTLLDNTTLDE